MKPQICILLACLFLLMSSQVEAKKVVIPPSKEEIAEQKINSIKNKSNIIHQDQYINVYLSKKPINFQIKRVSYHFSIYDEYNLVVSNLTDEPISFKGEILVRMPKEEVLMEIQEHAIGQMVSNNLPRMSGPGMMVSGGASAGQISQFKASYKNIIQQALENHIAEGPVSFSLAAKETKLLSFAIQEKQKPQLFFEYQTKGLRNIFYYGLDEKLAKPILDDEQTYKKAYINKILSDKTAGIYAVNLEKNQNVRDLDLSKLVPLSLLDGQTHNPTELFSKDNFCVVILKNISGRPSISDFVFMLDPDSKRAKAQAKIRAEDRDNLNITETQPGMLLLRPEGFKYEAKQNYFFVDKFKRKIVKVTMK